jgi:hypothetical protein
VLFAADMIWNLKISPGFSPPRRGSQHRSKVTAMNCRVCLLGCLWLLASFNVPVSAGQGGEVSASDDARSLLRNYERSLLPYNRFRARWTSQAYDWEAGKPRNPRGASREWTLCRDNDRCSLRQLASGAPEGTKFYENVVQREGQRLAVYANGVVIGRFRVTTDDFRDQLQITPASPSYGVIDDNFIPQFLDASPDLSARADALDGIPVQLVEGAAGDVRIQIWLDPQLGYVARRVRSDRTSPPERKSIVDFKVKRFEKRSEQYVPCEAAVTVIFPERPSLSAVFEEKIVNGQHVLREKVARNADGKVIMVPEKRALLEFKLSEIDFNPTFSDADFKFRQQIADGTRITMEDARQLQYAWQNGAVTAIAGAGARASAATARFQHDGSKRLRWLLVANVVVLVVLFCVVVYRRRQR